MRPIFLGLSAIGWKVMINSWWDKLLAAFLLGSVVLGSLYVLYRIYCEVLGLWKGRHKQIAVPTAIARQLKNFRQKRSSTPRIPECTGKPQSFGVYLGEIANPPTAPQVRLLSKWDILVLDPQQPGVLDALSTRGFTSMYILGRLDVQKLAEPSTGSNDDHVIRVLDRIDQTIAALVGRQTQRAVTGILLAGYRRHIQPVVLNETAKYVHDMGLEFWLEVDTTPAFCPTERECRETDMGLVRGLVYRNGTIRPDGERQDYFQMAGMRQVMRAVAAQRSRTLMTLWETVDTGVELQYAVVQRTFNWCRFSNSLCWIGSTAALTDVDAAAQQTVNEKPLGALMWLKSEDIMKAHDIWRSNNQISRTTCADIDDGLYDSLNSFVPGLKEKLRQISPSEDHGFEEDIQARCLLHRSDPASRLDSPYTRHDSNDIPVHPLSSSVNGDDFTGLGCFHLGLAVAPKDFADLLLAQRHLRDLNLLQQIEQQELCRIGGQIQILYQERSSSTIVPAFSAFVKDLLELLNAENHDGGNPRIRVYIGLHSGFSTSSKVQFWGLYDIDASTGILDLYLSSKTQDRAGTILHTFLSSRGCSRADCFAAEFTMANLQGSLSGIWRLPTRIVRDLEQLSPQETILFLRRLILAACPNDSIFLARLRECCEYQLMEVPTLSQLRELSSTVYLGGHISSSDLVLARLCWLREKNCWHPEPAMAISIFEEVENRVHQILMNGETNLLAQLGVVIQRILQRNKIDGRADVFALAVFCAFRKLAVDEIYLEVLDRNPYPNHAPDQAACFSENFALGSRCESFFDTTARCLGRVISDRYRNYYMEHQPPRREEGFTELPSAYAPMQIDLDPQDGKEVVPAYYQITFLGIFAVPALIDIMLLTTIGRGLYLTTFMTSTEKTMATTALMLALLVCGAIGSWITSGGCYYLYANAFPAMNMFCLTRFVAGVAVVLIGGSVGFVVVSVLKGITAALVFFFYFAMLTIYLLTLAALSIYQVPGSSFQSGRTVIMSCIPILLISPVVSLWTEHDIAVYFCVLSIFLLSLLFGARKTMSQWSTWYLNIPHVTDVEVVSWYFETRGETICPSEQMEDVAMGPYPRQALHAAVLKECGRHFWTKATTNSLVLKLARGHSSTMFLMSWYCRFRRTRMPLPYSATWNLTLKAALENMTNMQKGLKLHGAFLHWRHTGSDIMSGLLYFVIALLDKWAALVSGGAMVGLSAASSAEYRLAVGFGLCYYLIGAVSLDTVSQPLWTAANENTEQPITSLKSLRQATRNDVKARQKLYWKSLAKFFFMHIWGVSVTSALMWTFEGSRNATIMYLGYLGAYTGLLWYQYNKIYCGNDSVKCLTTSCIIGLPAGIILHVYLPYFAFSGAISLAVGTWIAAFYSLRLSKIGWPSIFWSKSVALTDADDVDRKRYSPFYFVSALEPYPEISQSTLRQTFESFCDLPNEERVLLEPSAHPGARVLEIILDQSISNKLDVLCHAFPDSRQMLQETADLWRTGRTTVEVVSANHLPLGEQHLRSIIRKEGHELHVLVFLGLDLAGDELTIHVHRNQKIIAETVVQATFEGHFGLSHDHSMLAELLVVNHHGGEKLGIPEGVKRQLETSLKELERIISNWDRSLLRYLLLGIDCEQEWDHLPREVRSFLLKRSCGQSDPISPVVESWIRTRICPANSIGLVEFIARCNLGATLMLSLYAVAASFNAARLWDEDRLPIPDLSYQKLLGSAPVAAVAQNLSRLELLQRRISAFFQSMHICIKFICLSFTADPEYQRELHYMIQDTPVVISWPIAFFLNSIWSFCKMLQGYIFPWVLFYGREKVSSLHSNTKGMKTVIHKDRIVIENLSGPSTCFFAIKADGVFQLSQYNGHHGQEPSDSKQLMAINTYADKLTLQQREEFRDQQVVNMFIYEYHQDGKKSGRKFPVQRQCMKGDLSGEIVQYDDRGYISTGSTFRDVNPVKFTYWYRTSAKFDDELLRGEYIFPHITIRVSWSMPGRKHPERLDEWIPFTKVTEATFVQGSDTYHASWTYEHKSHPEISTTLNGELVVTPVMIRDDWFHVLKKPNRCSFLKDNPLLSFSSGRSTFISRLLGLNIKRYPISTSQARTQLWKLWKGSKELDAVTARWLDEGLLRSDRILNSYWKTRDCGRLDAAKAYLDAQADTIMARVDVDPEISSWVHIAFKISDLYSFGQGGDSRINTRTLSTQLRDSDDELHILAMDTSTWPNEPGGVSACRRDMVNDLKTIKWHVVAESANDYGVPKFQIERNVQSLTIIPQWGLDFLNPTHGILENIIDSAVVQRSFDTRTADIEKHFLPILASLVRCSRTLHMTRHHVEEATKALCDLNTYFESSRNWNDVWDSDIVKQRWRELWLDEDLDDSFPVSKWWDFEKPTMLQMDQALNLWHRYLFIFSIPVPEKIPDVFQASHHFTGATYGILCKVKRHCTLHIWDHCISFRELTNFMSSAVSFDSPFVNSSLISLGLMGCILLEHHADVVLPCAAYFNPGWEIELGTAEGALEHRKTFARKIDPVVNGICNMERFEPIEKVKTEKPTAVMLSHVQYIKDIKNAILAADYIVNKWGFTDYSLHIYGDMERAASYSTECQELIASKGLRDHCVLKGLGNPSLVLQDAWLFLNSSLSEGLPLAMGEAALTGTPVVCTDVGASFCVVTDGETGNRFSEVVPPNDSESLARAQISILGLLGRWSVYAEDEPGLPPQVLAYPNPSPEEVKRITQRMYDKTAQRRRLGMLGRENVLKNFSSDRYLREHEQMLWIGKHRSPTYHARTSKPASVLQSSAWLTVEKSTFGVSMITPPLQSPRMTPDSWSLSSQPEPKGKLRKKNRRILYERRPTTNSMASSRAESDEIVDGGDVV